MIPILSEMPEASGQVTGILISIANRDALNALLDLTGSSMPQTFRFYPLPTSRVLAHSN
jgi:hypothetical protein